MTDDQVMAYIDAEMDQKQHFRKQDLGLKDLSIELGLPQSRIVKILHDREYGTLKEYLTTRRLLYACELLQTKPYYTIDSISSDAGFKARKTFQTLFKARIGVTPSQYRDNFKIQQNLEASTE
ncbi:MAG: helix-turn-helix domain-containing protein [Bacteroidales bacterium]|nr:helix-turn-helix domain-containing protein [Bacteroidales bacterium]